jgi:hypothetical protein
MSQILLLKENLVHYKLKFQSNFITQDGSQLKLLLKSKHVMFEHYMVYTER